MRASAKAPAAATATSEGSSTGEQQEITEDVVGKTVDATNADPLEATGHDVPEFGPLRADGGETAGAGGGDVGGQIAGAGEQGQTDDSPDLDEMAVEDEAMELISGSVRRQVEAEVFVPVMGR